MPYFSDIDRCPRHGAGIHIGSNVRGGAADVSALSEDGFLIKTQGEDIIIAGKTPRGTVYGVFHFLENFIGYCCIAKDIERFNKVKTPSLMNFFAACMARARSRISGNVLIFCAQALKTAS